MIAKNFTPINRIQQYGCYARLRMEYVANEAGTANWYDAMFQRIGLPKAPKGFDRPHLVRRSDSESQYVEKRRSVIIVHRASCQMRSSKFEDFYLPVKNAMPGFKVYVHDIDLMTNLKYYYDGTTQN